MAGVTIDERSRAIIDESQNLISECGQRRIEAVGTTVTAPEVVDIAQMRRRRGDSSARRYWQSLRIDRA